MVFLKVTMKDIAKVHGVSVNAVSLALNNRQGVSDEMRMKILRTAEELGYLETKEKFLKTFARTNICVMMQKQYSKDMDFYGRVLYAVVEEAKKSGYDAVMKFFDDEKFQLPEIIQERRVAGVVVIGKIHDSNLQQLREYHTPMILVDHASLTQNVDSIITDNKFGGYVMTRYLFEKGFRKIGFYGELKYSLSIKERYWGYRTAIEDLFGDELAYNLEDYIQRYSILSGMEEAVLTNDNRTIEILVQKNLPLPEAFICSNDKVAISLIMALQTLGYKVPEDVSIVGFDNIDICESIYPKLTTVNVNKEWMGKRAVQRLIYKMSHRDSQTENTVISVDLVERESVRVKR